MNPARWRQIESLYNHAMDVDESHRAAFLRDACGGDDDLRHEVEELIAQGGQAASFLEKAAIGEIATEFAAETAPLRQSWIGRQIGNYELLSLAGAGGMGEVYRARDTKLKRDVAIKVLPSEFSRDPDRISRFQREAELLASLNHPSIAAIYDLEEADGHRFLILELVEGETLADRIKRGPIAVEEALKIALQIAEAVEAAHNKNIIHRDLKPANIKVTAGGKVKVLDFGLAKALLDDDTVNLSNSPTISMTATQQGIILGTAAYMSPEQARGQAVDRRADVWAFGCVLFEMLSGRGLFGGKTVSDILASVLKAAPDWESLPAGLHPRIVHLLERCLEKEPQDRCQGLADARFEIKKVLADTGSVVARPSTETRPGLRSQLPWIAAIMGAALIASILVWIFKPTEPGQPQNFSLFPPEGQDFTIRRTSFLALSRDGMRIAYVGKDGINLGGMKALEDPKPIPGSKGALGHPLFSPDGQSVVYIVPSQLMRIPVGGGTAIPLIEGPPIRLTVGASWTKNDTILFASTAGLLEIPATGGTPKVIVKAKEGETLGSPELLPDGKSLLFSSTMAPGGIDRWESARILVLPKSGEAKLIWKGGGDPHYIPTGHIVYAQGNRLFALPFDIGTLKPTGPPVSFADGLMRSSDGTTDTGNYDISDTGTLVYVQKPATANPDGILASVSRDGHEERLNVHAQQYRSVRVSPDELHLAVDVQGKDEKSSIWIYDMSSSEMHQLTPGGHNYIRPIWRDNKTVTYGSDSGGTWRIYSQRADGSAEPVPLTAGDSRSIQQFPESWSPDGRTLSFVKTRNASKTASEDWGIWTYSMDTQTSNPFFDAPDSANDFGSVFSPDGTWLTYNSYPRTLAQPFPATGVTKQLGSGLGSLVWSRQNEVIYRQNEQGKVRWTAATVDYSKGNFEIRDRRPLAFPDGQTFEKYRSWDIALNGQKLVAIVPAAASPAPPPARARINIVLNFFEELKALTPPR